MRFSTDAVRKRKKSEFHKLQAIPPKGHRGNAIQYTASNGKTVTATMMSDRARLSIKFSE